MKTTVAVSQASDLNAVTPETRAVCADLLDGWYVTQVRTWRGGECVILMSYERTLGGFHRVMAVLRSGGLRRGTVSVFETTDFVAAMGTAGIAWRQKMVRLRREVSPKQFEVRWTITVDRPELRGPTFAAVAPGHKISQRIVTDSQPSAVRVFEGLLEGSEDFASEFVSSVEVVQLYSGRSPRVVRARRERFRRETNIERQRALLAVAARRNGALHLSFHNVRCIANVA